MSARLARKRLVISARTSSSRGMTARMFKTLPPSVQRVGLQYAKISERHPFVTASATAGATLFAADVTAQKIAGMDRWDRERSLSLTLFGVLYYGFPCKLIHLSYDRILGPGRAFVKMFLDVYVHTPIVLLPCFYALTGAVKGESPEQTVSQFQKEFVTAAFGSVLFWTPCQLVCFSAIPQHSRILFMTLLSFIHKSWLSWLSNRERVEAQKANSLEDGTDNLLAFELSGLGTPSVVIAATLDRTT